MNEKSGQIIQAIRSEKQEPCSFQSIFFPDDVVVPIRVPDYQRAFSWEAKQIELFIADLAKYQRIGKRYYFGHFIAEDLGNRWEIVDGQQRLTTFVLFLMVCRVKSPSHNHAFAYSMIEKFTTVSYDRDALETIGRNFHAITHFGQQKPPSDDDLIRALNLEKEKFTSSQRRIVLALLHFHHAFKNGKLDEGKIGDYIAVVINADCSHHLAKNKGVAVNIFEMHNTRGIPLTTLDIVKAMLMKFVYDHGGVDNELKVGRIQTAFGEIYRMEERLAAGSFRGEITLEKLLNLHLRVVDDGHKKTATDLDSPAVNPGAAAIVAYVDAGLRFVGGDKKKPEKTEEDGVSYALNLAMEFKKSVQIVSDMLPKWDEEEKDGLVGDVLILDPDLSAQFFLIVCRRLAGDEGNFDGRIGSAALSLWEKLLFTRDFHEGYYNLKGGPG